MDLEIFRECSAIPANVRMFMAGFVLAGKGEVHTCYHEGAICTTDRINLYVYTYAAAFRFSTRDSRKLLYNHADQGRFNPSLWSFGLGFPVVLRGHPHTFCKRLTTSIPFRLGGKN
jgi:hypothetical protein